MKPLAGHQGTHVAHPPGIGFRVWWLNRLRHRLQASGFANAFRAEEIIDVMVPATDHHIAEELCLAD